MVLGTLLVCGCKGIFLFAIIYLIVIIFSRQDVHHRDTHPPSFRRCLVHFDVPYVLSMHVGPVETAGGSLNKLCTVHMCLASLRGCNCGSRPRFTQVSRVKMLRTFDAPFGRRPPVHVQSLRSKAPPNMWSCVHSAFLMQEDRLLRELVAAHGAMKWAHIAKVCGCKLATALPIGHVTVLGGFVQSALAESYSVS
jgi:hypothetical protein